ncbi:MAG: fasciclin domain-containing protein [Bdellovibrionales bacterium]|jgi:uncharacterized surface protein with fasciclin (FAS1) repeats
MTYPLTKKLAMLLTTSTLALITAACSSEQSPRNFYATSGPSSVYVEEALADQNDLTMFYQALHVTGVINELNDNTEYTIFAPTNAAFSQIQPRVYPCFYVAQCRPQVAAILRNHIVPRNESIERFSRWGGNIPTIGNRRIDVEEPYKGHFTVEGYRVLYQNEGSDASRVRGNKISLYRIDGVIASDQDMVPFRTVPFVAMPAGVMEKTVTTYRTPVSSSYAPQTIMPNGYWVPGGYATNPVVYTNEYDDVPDSITETTTVTHTTTK